MWATEEDADLIATVMHAHGHPTPRYETVARRAAPEHRLARLWARLVFIWRSAKAGRSQRYRDTISRLFSKVVMENDLKWPQWEDQNQRSRTAGPHTSTESPGWIRSTCALVSSASWSGVPVRTGKVPQ